MLRLPRHDEAFWRSFALWGATRLPRWWLRWSPGPIGLLVGGSQARARRQVLENLRLVHGQRSPVVEALDLAETFAAFGHCLGEGMAFTSDRPPPFRYTVQGKEHLDRARDEGRGGVLVTAHLGSWDVAGAALSNEKFEVAVAMAPERDAAARAISDSGRIRTGLKVFHVGDDPLAALPLAQHLRKGGAVALQIDRVPQGMRARSGRLFGRPWSVPLGPFQLAQVTGAPVIPVFTARLGFVHHLVCAEPPIQVPRRASNADLDRAIASALGAVEAFIRRFPTQWFNFAPHPVIERSHEQVVERRRAG